MNRQQSERQNAFLSPLPVLPCSRRSRGGRARVRVHAVDMTPRTTSTARTLTPTLSRSTGRGSKSPLWRKRLSALIALALTNMLATSICVAQPATRPAGQQLCLHETDPNSPRKSKLKGDKPSAEILRYSIENDGHPDVLECWWNGKRARWIDENHDMKWTDMRGDVSGDSVQIDCDGDGYYDGPGDMNVKWVDDDGDGRPDAQIVTINPSSSQPTIHAGSSHYMVFIDVDHDGVNAYIDWTKFDWTKPQTGNWRTTGRGNFSPDYNGDSIFLKQHLPAWAVTDPRLNWENPFAFYDFDHDGCTEMSIRLLDNAIGVDPKRSYSGKDNEAYISYDLDNDSQKDNEFDYDMTLRFASSDPKHPGEMLDYSRYSDKHKVRAPQWVLDAHLYRYDNYRRIDDYCYVTHDKAYDEIWKVKWGQCWMVFDEDDDDHRWERVEMYYPEGDVYSTKRWSETHGDRTKAGISGHPQADSLGDRGEWDQDNSGGGKLYVGKWDQKLHLLAPSAAPGWWITAENTGAPARSWSADHRLSTPQKSKRLSSIATPTTTASLTKSPTITTATKPSI